MNKVLCSVENVEVEFELMFVEFRIEVVYSDRTYLNKSLCLKLMMCTLFYLFKEKFLKTLIFTIFICRGRTGCYISGIRAGRSVRPSC